MMRPSIPIFQSTPPARGATSPPPYSDDLINISIHAPREGGDAFAYVVNTDNVISIHAPREGDD